MHEIYKSKYREKINEIFKALYGEIFDEDGELYGETVYWYESVNMEVDYYKYLDFIKLLNLPYSIDEIAKFIIYTEYYHIGNNITVRNRLDFEKLKEIVVELLNE